MCGTTYYLKATPLSASVGVTAIQFVHVGAQVRTNSRDGGLSQPVFQCHRHGSFAPSKPDAVWELLHNLYWQCHVVSAWTDTRRSTQMRKPTHIHSRLCLGPCRKGLPVDRCLSKLSNDTNQDEQYDKCGAATADYWCSLMGYPAGASMIEPYTATEKSNKPTLRIRDGSTCTPTSTYQCEAYVNVTCRTFSGEP